MGTNPQIAAELAIAEAVERFGEVGLQVAAYHGGVRIVHAHAGVADADSGRPVDESTLFVVFSCAKAITATVIHRLVEAGTLAYDEPIASWWPEFGANGKAHVTVRDVLSHRSGLDAIPETVQDDYCTLSSAARVLEGASLAWPTGSTLRYHSLTFGSILGNLAVRATRRPWGALVGDLAAVAGVTDFRFGLAPDDIADAPRLARNTVTRAFSPDEVAGAPTADALEGARGLVAFGEYPHFLYGTGPGSNLICTADDLARVMASLRPDGLGAGPVLSPETIHAATIPMHGADGATVQSGMGLGYMLACEPDAAPNGWRFGPWPDAFGHMGAGGRMVAYSPSHDLSIAVTKNAVSPDPYVYATWTTVATAISRALGIPVRR